MTAELRTADGELLSALPVGPAPKAFADEPSRLSAPTKVTDKEAPFGRDDTGKPSAPHGLKADGSPRLTSSGKRSAPKVASSKQGSDGSQKLSKPSDGKDRSSELTGLVQLGWGVLSVASPSDAAALKVHGPGMVHAWNELGKQNASVGRAIDWLTNGGAYGAVVLATMPFAMQIWANRDKSGKTAEQLAGFGIVNPAHLEATTKADLEEIAAQYQQAAA